MMDFELKLEKPALNRAWISALVMGLSYFLGKLIWSYSKIQGDYGLTC